MCYRQTLLTDGWLKAPISIAAVIMLKNSTDAHTDRWKLVPVQAKRKIREKRPKLIQPTRDVSSMSMSSKLVVYLSL